MTNSPFHPDKSLDPAQKAVKDGLPQPMVPDTRGEPSDGYKVPPASRWFLRGPWEMAASIIIGIGIVMLMQPLVMWAYTYSFIVILTGTVMFLVVSHFPDGDD